jgi:hypothetical protein
MAPRGAFRPSSQEVEVALLVVVPVVPSQVVVSAFGQEPDTASVACHEATLGAVAVAAAVGPTEDHAAPPARRRHRSMPSLEQFGMPQSVLAPRLTPISALFVEIGKARFAHLLRLLRDRRKGSRAEPARRIDGWKDWSRIGSQAMAQRTPCSDGMTIDGHDRIAGQLGIDLPKLGAADGIHAHHCTTPLYRLAQWS